MQSIQCLFDFWEMQPNERVEKIMQIVTRGYLAGCVYVGFVSDIGRETVLRNKDNRTSACCLEIMRMSDLIRCLQPVAAADERLPCFPEWCEPRPLPVNSIQRHDEFRQMSTAIGYPRPMERQMFCPWVILRVWSMVDGAG